MNRSLRRLLIALAVLAVIFGGLFGAAVLSGRSLVLIENRSDAPVDLSVETRTSGRFSWAGQLSPKQRVIRTARLTGDSLVAVCREADSIHRTSGGYVTGGWPHLVGVGVNGCDAMRVDARRLP